MARGFRGTRDDVTDAQTPDNGEAQPTAEAAAPVTPTVKRAPVDVGAVTVAQSSVATLPKRPSKLDSNPVAVAVKNATPGTVYDVHAEPGKVDAVLSILRRAGQRHGVGVNIGGERQTVETDAGPRVLIQFATGPRRERKSKNATDTAADAGTPSE